jgi:DNA-binding MarR family transcriptional regulator
MRSTATLDACNCFAIRQAARHVTRLYEQHLAKADLTSAQFTILGLLGGMGEMTMAELASSLVMDRTTLLRAIQPLQRDDLLKTRPGDVDPRQLIISLSPAGERKLKQATPLWEKAQQEFEAEVGTREAAQLRRSLLTLAKSK